MMLINDEVHQWLKIEYMQLINKNGHAGITNLWLKTFLYDRSDIGEYGVPSRVGPGKIAPVAPPSWRP